MDNKDEVKKKIWERMKFISNIFLLLAAIFYYCEFAYYATFSEYVPGWILFGMFLMWNIYDSKKNDSIYERLEKLEQAERVRVLKETHPIFVGNNKVDQEKHLKYLDRDDRIELQGE